MKIFSGRAGMGSKGTEALKGKRRLRGGGDGFARDGRQGVCSPMRELPAIIMNQRRGGKVHGNG